MNNKRVTWVEFAGGVRFGDVREGAISVEDSRFKIHPYGRRCTLIDSSLPKGSRTVGIYNTVEQAKRVVDTIIKKED